jgi:DNA gyrase subunit A|nr:MAG TPA: DNA topoisomerase 2 beta [Caudoviricetes sp.]
MHNLSRELEQNFIEYAVAVNSDRALPDSKSGLKPVARRILWGAYDSGYTSSKEHVKCARIVGDVMGKWHPHGDSSIYGALVRLSQPWIMRYPLIDFHGNMGNISGDGPAAYRYTNARLAKITEDGLLNGLKKKNVDFIPNYDENANEPITLPAIFPNLLCNPNSGIGVAMACSWAPHNLKEVAQAIYDVMDGKEPTLSGPDFPTGGLIINKNDIPQIMATGRGTVKVRGQYKIEKNNIVFYEIPYGVSTEAILNSIGKACDEKEIEGISEVVDESSKKEIRIVISCKKDVNIEGVVKKLFAKTNLQSSFSYNQVGLVGKTPTELNLKDCISIYIEHNIDCLKKELEFDLAKAKARLHIVDGLLIALEDIDNVITLIKKSENSAKAKEGLKSKYNLSEEQAKAILDMRLSKLAHMEKIALENEKKELINTINDINDILINKSRQLSIIRERLVAIVKKYGDNRRTELAQIEVPKDDKEIEAVIPEDVVVITTQTGYIKRVPKKSFKVQRKKGKGVKSADSVILDAFSTNTIDTLMVFTSKGKMYKILVDNIPAGTNVSKGVPLTTLINCGNDESIVAVTSLNRKTDAKYVVFITKKGLVKKTELEEYTKIKRSTGIAAIKIKDGDDIANVTFLKDEDLILITKKGQSIHFITTDIKPIGRTTSGVKGIKMDEDDEIVIGLPIHNEKDKVAVFTSKGLMTQTELDEFPCQGRGGKGLMIYKPKESTGNIIGALMLSEEDNILAIGRPNSICISAREVPTIKRGGAGNLMIKDSIITSVVKL